MRVDLDSIGTRMVAGVPNVMRETGLLPARLAAKDFGVLHAPQKPSGQHPGWPQRAQQINSSDQMAAWVAELRRRPGRTA